jgi:hypothetical protein
MFIRYLVSITQVLGEKIGVSGCEKFKFIIVLYYGKSFTVQAALLWNVYPRFKDLSIHRDGQREATLFYTKL